MTETYSEFKRRVNARRRLERKADRPRVEYAVLQRLTAYDCPLRQRDLLAELTVDSTALNSVLASFYRQGLVIRLYSGERGFAGREAMEYEITDDGRLAFDLLQRNAIADRSTRTEYDCEDY